MSSFRDAVVHPAVEFASPILGRTRHLATTYGFGQVLPAAMLPHRPNASFTVGGIGDLPWTRTPGPISTATSTRARPACGSAMPAPARVCRQCGREIAGQHRRSAPARDQRPESATGSVRVARHRSHLQPAGRPSTAARGDGDRGPRCGRHGRPQQRSGRIGRAAVERVRPPLAAASSAARSLRRRGLSRRLRHDVGGVDAGLALVSCPRAPTSSKTRPRAKTQGQHVCCVPMTSSQRPYGMQCSPSSRRTAVSASPRCHGRRDRCDADRLRSHRGDRNPHLARPPTGTSQWVGLAGFEPTSLDPQSSALPNCATARERLTRCCTVVGCPGRCRMT